MESIFFTDVTVRYLDDETAELEKELVYQSKLLRRSIVVPIGFVTDFASVPRLPITFALTGGKAKASAIIHDFLYQTHLCEGRKQADRVFLEAMEVTEVSWWRRILMYNGVRFGGGSSWKSGPERFTVLNDTIK